jgi:hypothetical protein
MSAAQNAPRPYIVPVAGHCPACHDFGIMESNNAGDLYSIASYCDCVRGQERRRLNSDEYSPQRVNLARKKLLALAGNKTEIPAPRKGMKRVGDVIRSALPAGAKS